MPRPVVDKATVRQRVLAQLAALPSLRRFQEEELVTARILSDPAWRAAGAVALYASLRPEFSTVSLANAAWLAGKQVWFPKVDGPRLRWGLARNWDDLEPGAYGIREPRATHDVPPVDLVVVPGVAFQRDGLRLGRGGGYYDRFLADTRIATWAPVFSCQILEQIPAEAHDQKVSRVIGPDS